MTTISTKDRRRERAMKRRIIGCRRWGAKMGAEEGGGLTPVAVTTSDRKIVKRSREEAEEEEAGEEEEDDRIECTECSIKIDYDDCVHYLEDTYLCQVCGKDKDDICIECYERPCGCEATDGQRGIVSSR